MPLHPAARKHPTRSARPRRCGPRGAGGFTLLEVVAAFAILALGLAMVMQIAAGGMRQARQAAEYSEASLLAQSLLDTVGVGERLEEGSESGEWEGGYRWQLDVLPYEDATDGVPADPQASPVRLLELQLTVSWERGGNTRESRFRTLRATLPENL